MSITQLIEQFYVDVKKFERSPTKMVVGQIAWVPCQFVEAIPNIVDSELKTPTDHQNISLKVRKMNHNDFKKKDHLPVKALYLNQTEELILSRAKKRLCVLLGKADSLLHHQSSKQIIRGKKHLGRNDGLFLPLYGIESDPHKGGFPTEFVDRIKVLMYPRFFYFPRGVVRNAPCNNFVYEAIGRLDRIFPMNISYLGVQVTSLKISNDFRSVLQGWIANFLEIPLHQKVKDDLDSIIEIVQEAYSLDQKRQNGGFS